MPKIGSPPVPASGRSAGAASLFARAVMTAALALSLAQFATAARASVVIQIADDPGEGLNDPVGALPVGGNTGTTRGAQRLIALQYAAEIMSQLVASPVDIVVAASFDELPCGLSGAVLGSGGATNFVKDFANAPRASTWYHAALADKIAGVDLNPGKSDIVLALNSAVGITCSFPLEYYYGLDAQAGGGELDVVTIALHGLAQGLGFSTLVDPATGVKGLGTGFDDVFMLFLEDHTTGKTFPFMTDAERAAASKKTGELHWVGSAVVNNSDSLSSGRDPSGHVLMHAPDPVEEGLSVSRWDASLFPNELMEPVYTGAHHDVGLLRFVFEDIGWFLGSTTTTSTTTTTLVASGCGDPSGDSSYTATDALSILRAAVGVSACPLCVCDVDAVGGVTASDALRLLLKVVGIEVQLSCPAC